MKKILLFLFLSLPFYPVFATPATEQSTQKLMDTLESIQYLDFAIKDENINKATETIMRYHKIPLSEAYKQQIFEITKKYYASSEFKKKYYQMIAKIFQENSTEEEIQLWINYYSSDKGKSIFKNERFRMSITEVIDDLFPSNFQPSVKAQEKIANLMKKFTPQPE